MTGRTTTAPSGSASASVATSSRRGVVVRLRTCIVDHWPVIGLLVWMFLACCFPLVDTDLFWHLKTGEWILENLAIPGYDLYTYTDFDKRWVDLHWGFQVVAAILYRIGGPDLLVLVKAAMITVAVGIGCYSAGPGLQSWQRCLCWILPSITISGRGYERPEIVTVLFLAAWLAVVSRLEHKPKLIWLLPVIQVVWINCHALYILGLVVGACYWLDDMARRIADARWGLGAPSLSLSPNVLIRAAALCVLAALMNPYFEEGALFPFILLRKFTVEQDFYSVRIGEFQRPIAFLMKYGPRNLYLNAEILLWLACAASFVPLIWRRRFSVFRTLLFGAFSYLGWKASRNTNIFSIVAGFVLMQNLDEIVSASPDNAIGERPRPPALLQWGIGIPLGLMIAAVVTGYWNQATEQIRPFRLGEGRAWFAHGASKFMSRPGYPQRVFAANFGVASVYSYHNGPTGKIYMDGRLEVCSRELFARFNEISRRMAIADPTWIEMLRLNDGSLPAVMLDSRYSRDMISGIFQMPGWRLVYADQATAVFFDVRTADSLHLEAVRPDPLMYPPGP